MTTSPRPPVSRVPAELALGAVTFAACWSLTRLFTGDAFLGPILLVATVAHLSAAASRRRLPTLARTAVFLIGGACTLTAAYSAGDSWLGFLPTPATASHFGNQVHLAFSQFDALHAPVEPLPGFLLTCAIAVWVLAWTADWIAFRAWAALEAIIPGAALFSFAALLGTTDGRVAATVLFLSTSCVFVAVHRACRDGIGSAWVGGQAALGNRALTAWGVPLAALAVVAGSVVGVALPGSSADPLVDWRGRTAQPSQQLVSPLVEMRRRLLDQSDQTLFTVQADHPAYWRQMSLEVFTGQEWRSTGSFGHTSGTLPQKGQGHAAVLPVQQTITLGVTGNVWVPAAFEVRQVKATSAPLRWDAASASLIVDGDNATADDLTYTVRSEVPDPTPEQVAQATAAPPSAIAARYLGLPTNLNPEIGALANRVTAGAATPAAKAQALERWFRDPANFTYSLDVPDAQSSDALSQFLFTDRRGYCQQFAGAFAAMARTLGIPARVAVGYTPGSFDPGTGTYTVRGTNAHAWPEVWLSGIGWLPFEPTPQRGLPGTATWSSTTAADDQSGLPGGVAPLPLTATTTTAPGSAAAATPAPKPTPKDAAGGGGTPSAGSSPSTSAWSRLLPWLLALAALVLAWCLGAPLALAWRRQHRRRWATSPTARIALAWDEATASLAALGHPAPVTDTPSEVAAEAGPALLPAGAEAGDGAEALATLADLASEARWAPHGPAPADAERAERALEVVQTCAAARLGALGRLRRAISPRLVRAAW